MKENMDMIEPIYLLELQIRQRIAEARLITARRKHVELMIAIAEKKRLNQMQLEAALDEALNALTIDFEHEKSHTYPKA